MEENVLKIISSIDHALDSIANKEFKEYDLTKGKYQYLNRISENVGITQTELGELLRVDKGTVSRAVNKLIKDGLVIVNYESNNSKSQHLDLTNEGREYAKIIKRENIYSTKQSLQGLSETEIKQLINLLNKVEKNTGHEWQNVQLGFKREY